MNKIHSMQDAYSVISTFLELLIEGISTTESEILVSEMPEKRVILGQLL